MVLNGLRLPVGWVAWIWPAALAVSWVMVKPVTVRRAPFRTPAWVWWLCGVSLVLLSVPRFTYLAEVVPGAVVLAQADDYGRLAELISMTQSVRYPLLHAANQSFYLSHYYTALYPMAWLKTAVPVLTLKECIVAGNLLYHVLMMGALAECAPRLARRKRGAVMLAFLFTLYGGLDLLVGYPGPLQHKETWAALRLGCPRQISSFFTASYWTVHHMAAAWAAILAYTLSKETLYVQRWRKPLVAGMLLAAVAAGSGYVALTLPLVAWKEMWMLARRVWKRPGVVALLAGVVATPLWMAMHRLDGGGFFVNIPKWNIASYVAAICVIDLIGIPFYLGWRWKRLTGEERRWLIGFWIFLILTWGVESIGFNNFMMRGGLVPVAALMVMTARRPAPRWLVVAAAATSLTTIHESATMTYRGLMNSNWYWEARGLEIPTQVQARIRTKYPEVARDAKVRYYEPDAGDRRGMDKYNAERMIQGLKVEEMVAAEREIARYRE